MIFMDARHVTFRSIRTFLSAMIAKLGSGEPGPRSRTSSRWTQPSLPGRSYVFPSYSRTRLPRFTKLAGSTQTGAVIECPTPSKPQHYNVPKKSYSALNVAYQYSSVQPFLQYAMSHPYLGQSYQASPPSLPALKDSYGGRRKDI